MMFDVMAPEKGPRIRKSIYSDGEWFWSESLPDYVENYLLKPSDEFLDHCRAHEFVPARPTVDQINEILTMLGVPPSSKAEG